MKNSSAPAAARLDNSVAHRYHMPNEAMATEKRRSQRIDLNEPASLHWQLEDGNVFSQKATLVNLADDGALITAAHKVPLRQLVQLKVPSWNVDTAATIRHVRQKGLQYSIGLELNNPIEAKPARKRWT